MSLWALLKKIISNNGTVNICSILFGEFRFHASDTRGYKKTCMRRRRLLLRHPRSHLKAIEADGEKRQNYDWLRASCRGWTEQMKQSKCQFNLDLLVVREFFTFTMPSSNAAVKWKFLIYLVCAYTRGRRQTELPLEEKTAKDVLSFLEVGRGKKIWTLRSNVSGEAHNVKNADSQHEVQLIGRYEKHWLVNFQHARTEQVYIMWAWENCVLRWKFYEAHKRGINEECLSCASRWHRSATLICSRDLIM